MRYKDLKNKALQRINPRTYSHFGWAGKRWTEAALPANLKFTYYIQIGTGVKIKI
jgi:hypothetical protein